jgi:polyhydroxyalkanoate synthesis regulator phasin
MSLNFDYTCPIIDENINEFYYEISYFLNELVKGYYLHTDEEKEKSIDWHIKNIYKVFEMKFELVRSSNQDIRRAAENQLDELEKQIEKLKAKIKGLEDEIKEYKEMLNCEAH